MIRFECDYAGGCHPQLLDLLVRTNNEQTCGYGEDHYCKEAADLIRKECALPDADVHFVVGGTQANSIVICQLLRPHQGAVCAESGHIAVHEAGAVEATGHKVLPITTKDGKINAEGLSAYLKGYWADDTHEHMVQPGMVYISYPTEVGTIYSKAELSAIYDVCRQYEIPLFIDGARLGYGLMSSQSDLTLPELAQLCDVFYIGGTKVGAIFGEAIVFTKPAQKLSRDFRSIMKQNGAMLAKGRFLGLQFKALFENNLYWDISANAIKQADKLREALTQKGFRFAVDSPTNQLFPILPKSVIADLSRDFAFMVWPDLGEPELMTRFCTSWATTDEEIQKLIDRIRAL